MPIYEYACANGHEFEMKRPISEMNAPIKCPQCGANSQKLTSVFASQNSGVGIMVPSKQAFRGATPAAPPKVAAKAKGKAAK